MTPEAQRIAIAEACGWKFRREFTNSVGGLVKEWIKEGIGSAMIWELPDYLNDLNAMHEAEKVLVFSKRLHYYRELQAIRSKEILPDRVAPQDCIMATAAQRAEAFLKTLGLWKDG
jgi:hypothetical protein